MRYCERTAKAKLGGVERDRHDEDLRSCILVSLALQGIWQRTWKTTRETTTESLRNSKDIYSVIT